MKKLIIKIDNAILGGRIQWLLANQFGLIPWQRLGMNKRRSMVMHYNKNFSQLLSALCDYYGSDKGEVKTSGHPYPWRSHTYTDFYTLLFGQRRESIRHVFECGIGTNNPGPSSMGTDGRPGASLRVWQDYFPNAHIIGADIDRNILFNEGRIQTYYVDQTDPATIRAMWTTIGIENFDVMIDDGLHIFSAGICLFENSIHKLAPNGIYMIEDISPHDLLMYQRYFVGKDYRVVFINLFRDDITPTNNNLIMITR